MIRLLKFLPIVLTLVKYLRSPKGKDVIRRARSSRPRTNQTSNIR